jgi:Fe-Mn family superoxide dismutase
VSERIHDEFGSLRDFIENAQMQAASLIGCGWLWVVWQGARLAITTTENVTTYPLDGGTVLLALDLWEHAYYPDFRSRRCDYVAACFEKLINWDFANVRLRSTWVIRKRLRQPVDWSDVHKTPAGGRYDPYTSSRGARPSVPPP